MTVKFLRRTVPAAFCMVSSFLCLQGCKPSPQMHSQEFYVFGTVFTLKTVADSDANVAQAYAQVQHAMRALHNQFHAWKPGELTQLNQCLKTGQWCDVSSDMQAALQQAGQLSLASQEWFNPVLGAVIGAWGFHRDDYPFQAAVPSADKLQALMQPRPSVTQMEWQDDTLRARQPNNQYDLGGFAKGLALKRAVELMQKSGYTSVLADAGGDMLLTGAHNWRVGIRKPFSNRVLAGLQSEGETLAVFTSGVYQRYALDGEERYPHLLDPFTGMPVQTLGAATVVHPDPVVADAAATALVAAGEAHWKDVLQSMGLEQALVVYPDGDVFVTARLHARLLEKDPDTIFHVITD